MISRSCLRLRNLAVVPPRSSPAERPSSAIVAIAASRGRNSLGFFSSSSSPSHPSPSQPRPRRLPFPSSNITSNTNTTTTSHRSFHPSTPSKMRIPYTPDPAPAGTLSPEDEAVVERVRARRAPRPLQPLDLALLHSPPVADGWNSFLGAIRTKTESVPAGLRELAICRVAVCNRAWYEWAHHAPLAIAAGVSEAFMNDYVKGVPGDLEHAVTDEAKARCADEWGVGAREWAVLRYTDEMTRNVHVPDAVFAEIKGLFGDKEIVELTATVAAYNCVSRFLVALDVGERNATGPDDAGPAH